MEGTRLDRLIHAALEEDIGAGDITTRAVLQEPVSASASITANSGGIIAGLPIAGRVFLLVDPETDFTALVEEGARVEAGTRIAKVAGSAEAILSAERTALNFLQHLSGIATQTALFVEALGDLAGRVKLMDTRKTTPGLRMLEKYAVAAGGGTNHRFGLFDGVLIKDNHLQVVGSLPEAVRRVRENLPERVIEVEVETLEEVREAVEAGAGIILLDNMTLEDIRKAVAEVAGKAELEVSGGVDLSTVAEIAKTGVDRISVGALTQGARPLDISLEIDAGPDV